jgi:signal transduction histidine kinase
LAIVKHIVKVHKGTIGVDSNPGKGSKFFIILPKNP